MFHLARGPQHLRELSRRLGYAKDHIYRSVSSLEREGYLLKFRQGKEVVISLSRSPRAHRLAELYVTAVAHGVDPEEFDKESIVDTWKFLATRRHASLRECVDATRLSYESVRRAFHFFVRAGLAKTLTEKPLRISLESSDLNRHLGRYFLETSGRTIFALSTAPFTKLYARPSEVRELLLSEEGSVVIQGVDRNLSPREPIKIVEVMQEEVTPETVFLREVQGPDGVEDFCIHLLSNRSVDLEQLLRLSRERGMVNVVGCYLDILSDLDAGLVAKREAEAFLPFISHGDPPAFLESEREFGKEGWEKPYEGKWNVDLYLDLGAIEHGIRAVS
jgi:DNA-binding transcriptional regulator YhcF (GntR family)